MTTDSIDSRPTAARRLDALPSQPRSIETRTSWVIAFVSVGLLCLSFGGPWIAAVGLKAIAADLGGVRSVPSLANSLAWLGSAAGGILMGHAAHRYGVRWTVMFGSAMIGIGLLISTGGKPWQLWLGHGLFIGLLGNAGLNAPLYVYVSRWFDRRRGSALALISSGAYLAGLVWPMIFERAIAHFGWQWTMTAFAGFQFALITPLALLFLQPPPAIPTETMGVADGRLRPDVMGWSNNVAFATICAAGFLCCVAMAMPQQHLVAYCSDLGISATVGAAMLSALLGMGFFSRQAWGWAADRIGGLPTALLSSTLQAAALVGFLFIQDPAGLFAVSSAFGIGFSALIPAYVLALRELYPVAEAYWRVPTLLFLSGSGMAVGGWLAGYLYDLYGYYLPAFATGVAFNVANIAVLFMLVVRQQSCSPATSEPAGTPKVEPAAATEVRRSPR